MKAITIKQPWASLICNGFKDIENRTWKTDYRGSVLIHVSGSPANINLSSDLISHIRNNKSIKDIFVNSDRFIKSAIIGSVDIVDCVRNHDSVWAEKEVWNWVLENPVLFTNPILNIKGKLSFWDYEYERKES